MASMETVVPTDAGLGVQKQSGPTAALEDVPRNLAWSDAFFGLLPAAYGMLVGRTAPARELLAAAVGWGALVLGLSRALTDRYYRAVRMAGIAAVGVPAALFVLLVGYLSWGMSRHRKAALESARNLLLERIGDGRARRYGGYDLYLPPEGAGEEVAGLVFLPGAAVEHTAYAGVAASLSDQGILVAVVNLEPLRYASMWTGADSTDILKIMHEVDTHKDNLSVSNWGVGGHSAGATAAFNLAFKMKPLVSELVMWGAGATGEMFGSLRNSATNVIVVNATEDGLFNNLRWMFEQFKARLPPEEGNKRGGHTEYVMIEGGNHSGFGHYEHQIWPTKDNYRTITLEQQQNICVKVTAESLTGSKSLSKGKQE